MFKFDIKKFRKLTKEDYEKQLEDAIKRVQKLEQYETFIRILNTDRMILYSVLNQVMYGGFGTDYNRDELNFILNLCSFYSNYILDDSESTIKWGKFDSGSGNRIECKESDLGAEPYLAR